MIKEVDNDQEVIYIYGNGIDMTDKIRLDKKKSVIQNIKNMDTGNSDFHFQRAGQKLASCHRKEQGFPDKLIYCS
ncbi:hypothetical protein [Bacillus sp. JJ722]|uniref:hypothetical protein n=1 Tax=Bacillus sp. JJ722 TaxID=3122973 RepID=UPI002FFE3C20